jgi:hypothetical protein
MSNSRNSRRTTSTSTFLHSLNQSRWRDIVLKHNLLAQAAAGARRRTHPHLGFSFHDDYACLRGDRQRQRSMELLPDSIQLHGYRESGRNSRLETGRKPKASPWLIMEPLLGGRLADPPPRRPRGMEQLVHTSAHAGGVGAAVALGPAGGLRRVERHERHGPGRRKSALADRSSPNQFPSAAIEQAVDCRRSREESTVREPSSLAPSAATACRVPTGSTFPATSNSSTMRTRSTIVAGARFRKYSVFLTEGTSVRVRASTAVLARGFVRRRSPLRSGCPRCLRCWPDGFGDLGFYHPANQRIAGLESVPQTGFIARI